MTPTQMIDAGREWMERQMAHCAQVHGTRWPDHEQWVRDYLLEQLRQRYQARGWRRTKR